MLMELLEKLSIITVMRADLSIVGSQAIMQSVAHIALHFKCV